MTTHIIGIVNLSPDSFSGDGLNSTNAAVRHAASLLEAGAAMLDIGAESTRPGAVPLDAATEQARLLPPLKAIVKAFPNVPLSVDTYKAEVAEAALAEGASVINDVTGGADARLLALAAQAGCRLILMHNAARQGQTTALQHGIAYAAPDYEHFLPTIHSALTAMARRAEAAGVKPAAIILDPGLGFGKTVAQNIALLRAIPALSPLGYPLLVGASRKSFIGEICGSGVDDRVIGSAIAAAYAANAGATFVRVHDVKATRQAIAMLSALERPAA